MSVRESSMAEFTWAPIDAALDQVEEGDFGGVVRVFLMFQGHRIAPTVECDKWTRVSVASFSRHIDMPRHRLDSLIRAERERQRKTA